MTPLFYVVDKWIRLYVDPNKLEDMLNSNGSFQNETKDNSDIGEPTVSKSLTLTARNQQFPNQQIQISRDAQNWNSCHFYQDFMTNLINATDPEFQTKKAKLFSEDQDFKEEFVQVQFKNFSSFNVENELWWDMPNLFKVISHICKMTMDRCYSEKSITDISDVINCCTSDDIKRYISDEIQDELHITRFISRKYGIKKLHFFNMFILYFSMLCNPSTGRFIFKYSTWFTKYGLKNDHSKDIINMMVSLELAFEFYFGVPSDTFLFWKNKNLEISIPLSSSLSSTSSKTKVKNEMEDEKAYFEGTSTLMLDGLSDHEESSKVIKPLAFINENIVESIKIPDWTRTLKMYHLEQIKDRKFIFNNDDEFLIFLWLINGNARLSPATAIQKILNYRDIHHKIIVTDENHEKKNVDDTVCASSYKQDDQKSIYLSILNSDGESSSSLSQKTIILEIV